jgi:hypothetical protein
MLAERTLEPGLSENPKILRADNLLDLVSRGYAPGVETPVTPDEPDVLDGGGEA